LVKPGRFVQFVEADITSFKGGDEHAGMSEFMRFCKRAFPEAKINHSSGPSIKDWLKESGTFEVTEDVLSFEMGVAASSEEMRKETTDNMLAIIDNLSTFCLRKSSTLQSSLVVAHDLTRRRNPKLLVHGE
jgi:hypothetical protein